VPRIAFLVVGGTRAQVEAAERLAREAGAPLVFTGQRPAHEIPHFIDLSDVLVSPRTSGTNTPLKIYSYLRFNRPIVATDLYTHTQVLTPEVARLAAAEPEPFAQAITDLLADPERGRRLADAAAALARQRYSREAYVARTAAVYASVGLGSRLSEAGVTGTTPTEPAAVSGAPRP
jgi:glycosyltransferase involved in cell wall biosynthesis